MPAKIKNYDILCYQLRNNLYSRLDNPLKNELDQLSGDIKQLIVSGELIGDPSIPILEQIFNLRIKAIKWLTSEGNFDYENMHNEIISQIERMGANKKFEVLTENLLFAIRCNQRVVESVMNNSENASASLTSVVSQLPEITYQQFLASLAYAIPDEVAVQKIVDLTNSSLRIEFVMLAADIIYDDNLKLSTKTINDLAFLVADAGQDYLAIATDLGIVKKRLSVHRVSNFSFDSSFLKEQTDLADLGLEDFDKIFSD